MSENCNVTLCASQNNIAACRKYLSVNQTFQGTRFSEPNNLYSSLYTITDPIRYEIAKFPHRPWKVPFRKVYRFGERFLVPLNSRDIRKSDIYHSPVHSIPDQINKNFRIKKFITIHDMIPIVCQEHRSPSCVDYLKQRMASIRPDTFIVCVSNCTKNDLLNHMPYLDREKISVVHLAAGEYFYPCHDQLAIEAVKRKYSIPPEGFYLLALSTLSPRKNFNSIVKSFVSLLKQEKMKDLNLVLAGSEGWEFQEIYHAVEEAGEFSNKIIITGYVPDEDLAPLYSGAMAFVRPHDIEIAIEPLADGMAAVVEHVHPIGPVVRVELRHDAEIVEVELSRERHEALQLTTGQSVWFRPRQMKVFENGRSERSTVEKQAFLF